MQRSFVPYGVRRASIGAGRHRADARRRTCATRRTAGVARRSPPGAQSSSTPCAGARTCGSRISHAGPRLRVSTKPIAQLPAWSPDGESLAYVAGSIQKGVVTIAAADGRGVASTVACPGQRCDPTDWSPDGRWLLATVYDRSDQDVWMLPARGHDDRAAAARSALPGARCPSVPGRTPGGVRVGRERASRGVRFRRSAGPRVAR